ncbi:SCO family protein [Microbacterium elymi]|uniref:SCO family protein n=1 Tax=Microbacterium elymi TaxID=2909587 RepID=A0ABY5NMC2_9MICO|nr:SCO family protein [Microbacterium elymi]UUT36322.1 SCO family protein [Microbacterium elymi]
MTRDDKRPLQVWQRTWVLWISSAGLLAVIVALTLVAVGAGRAPSAPRAVDVLPAGVNEATASLLGVAPVATDPVSAPSYRLTDQRGRVVDPAKLRGKVVVLTFSDDRCTDLCAMLATDILAADDDLSASARGKIEFVSINANPYYPKPSDVRAWSEQNGLGTLPNWEYLTGSAAQAERCRPRLRRSGRARPCHSHDLARQPDLHHRPAGTNRGAGRVRH